MNVKPEDELTGPSLTVPVKAGGSEAEGLSQVPLRSTVQAGFAAKRILADDLKGYLPSLDQLIQTLEQQAELTHGGDLRHLETILTAQAHTLDLLFNRLVRLGYAELSEWMDMGEKYLRLAFRAQAQCRATAATLSDMKHPRPMALVAQQTNIAHRPQPVNNGSEPLEALSDIPEAASAPNKVLEHGG